MSTNTVHALNYFSGYPWISLISARLFAKETNAPVLATIGNVCMLIDKKTNIQQAKKEYYEKVKFLVEIEAQKRLR